MFFKAHSNCLENHLHQVQVLTWGVLLLSGCTTYGTVYVGQPEVHTRDRLVAERHDEAAWLRTKLKPENLEEVGTQIAGYRDIRAFTGLFASLKADIDPAGAAKKKLDSDTAEAEAEAAYWNAKAKAKAAKDAYENPKSEEKKQEASKYVNTITTDVTTTEFLRNPDGSLIFDKNTGHPIEAKKTMVDETTKPADPDVETVAKATEAAKAAATQAVSEVKQTVNAVLTKVNEATSKLDEALKTGKSGHFSEAEVKSALTPPDPTVSKVTPSPLNKLHDQMAYRDTINAALRQVELDDAHDLAGQQLYELTLDTTIVPGNHSTQYAQVELSLYPLYDGDKRRKNMNELFHRWIGALNNTLYEETYGLLKRNKNGNLSKSDEEFIDWFLFNHAPVVSIELAQRLKVLKDLACTEDEITKDNDTRIEACKNPVSKGIGVTDANLGGALTEGEYLPHMTLLAEREKLRLLQEKKSKATSPQTDLVASLNKEITNQTEMANKLPVEAAKKSAIAIKKATTAFADVLTAPLGNLNDETEKNKRTLARAKAIPWAVWAKYRNELSYFVEITPPTIDAEGKIGGLEVTPVPGILIDDRKGAAPDPDLYPDLCPKGNVIKLTNLGDDPGFRMTGICAFTDRIIKAEDHPVAISVSPKEAAQNVSEVAAREQMLELMLNLTAATASLKANGAVDTKFLKRRKEQVHALTRKPQVIGFGQGRERFGWLLGPRFGIDEDGKSEWLHEAVRHDVSAAVVVPGWWRYMHVGGIYSWVDNDGKTMRRECIWGGKLTEEDGKFQCAKVSDNNKPYVSVSLPMSANPMAEITRALVSPAGARNRYSVFADRRPPVISEVVAGDKLRVTAGGKVSLLIQGRDLWRSPQVFLGSVEADSVKVLSVSDKEALLATFNSLPYPGTTAQRDANVKIPQQVTVLTAFGHDQFRNDVSVFPPPKPSAPPVTKATGTLMTTIWPGADPEIVFNIPKVEQTAGVLMLRIREKGQVNWVDLVGEVNSAAPSTGKAGLKLVGDEARFKLQRAAETKVMEVMVLRLANNATDMSNGIALLEKPATLVLFKVEDAEKGTRNLSTLQFEKDGTYKGGELAISFIGNSKNDPLFAALSTAYTGWDTTFPANGKGKAKIRLYETRPEEATATLAAVCSKEQNDTQRVCTISRDTIGKAFKDSLPELVGKPPYNIQLLLDGKDAAGVPVKDTVTITQKSS